MTYNDYKNDLDGFYFISDENDELKFESFKYNDPGEVISAEIGDMHHIILFKETEEGNLYAQDMFEAILVDPITYAGNMLKCGFFGMISKKTTTSQNWIDLVWEKLNEQVDDNKMITAT